MMSRMSFVRDAIVNVITHGMYDTGLRYYIHLTYADKLKDSQLNAQNQTES